MAKREERKDSKSGELSDNAPEVDDSSVSEYEEIIEEVTATDYSDAEGDFPEEEVTEVEKSNQGNNASENKELSKNIKEQEKVEKEETKNKKEDQLVEEVVKKVAEVKVEANLKTAEESKVSRPNSTEACADSTDSKSVNDDKGESLVPLLQGILQKSLPTNAAKATKTEIESTKQAAEKSTRTRTNKQGCSHSCSCSSELSSDLCTVNNCNNNSNNNNSKNSKNSTDDNTNKLTNSEKQTTTITSDTNSNQSLDTNTTQPTMTRGIVMPKSDAQSGKVAGSSSNSSGNSTSRSSDITTKQRQLDRLCVPQKEDSGTESGEDLRLIAAGLRDSLQLQSDTNLIEEVTAALSRLEISLKEGKDIPVDGSKREALLALVARLQTGLSSPDAVVNLANITSNGGPFDETSSPEADGHRSNRQRFARRRNRNSRHTVGVSREELADARRYMEDMQLIENISNCTTPEGGMSANPITPPQWFPVEKNPSLGAILTSTSSSTLYRPNQFVDSQHKTATMCLNGGDAQIIHREKDGQKSKRPTSGNFSVSFQPNVVVNDTHFNTDISRAEPADYHQNGNVSPDSSYKSNRFTNKKQLLKRANTIDIPKSKKYNPDFDTDSEQEDKAPQLGLKRALQVNVKHKVRNVIPPFVPKTENDHKFLAFINKQSAKPGLGWTGSRSVSNWTNKFGNIKHTFEVGAAAQVTTGKPPQAPGHVPHNAAKNYWQKQVATQDYQQQQQYLQYQQQQQQQQQALQQQHAQQQLQRSQQEANERQRRAAERERLERERIELDRLERQRLERERQERDRLEREFYEREIVERERLAAAQHAAMPSMTVPKPAPVNKFQHAPQSVFRPIDNNETHNHNIFKPIPQLPQKVNTWQPPSILNKPLSAPVQLTSASPQFLTTKQSVNGAQVTSPSSTASSPIGLPWVAKPAVDNSDFRKKAHTFEERSQNDNHPNSYLQRHHSLRSPKSSQPQMNEYRKRPSLPSVANPYMASQSQYVPQQQLPVKPQSQQIYASSTDVYAMAPPPPTNISFTYADLSRNNNYKSYPCLPSAVETSITADYMRQRESSLTDPNATPLVLTTSNPTYEPPTENRAYYNHAPPLRQFDYASPMDSAPASPSCLTMLQADYTDDDLDSDNLMEYRAETRVMSKPQSQTAVTIRDRRTAHASDDEVFGKNSRNAQTLLHTMRNIGKNGNGVATVKKEPVRKVESPKVCLSPDGRAYQAPIVEPLFPEITKFEPNRTPEYIAENKIKTQTQSKQKKPRPKTPPMPNQQMDRSLQLALAEEKYSAEQQKYLENKKYSNVSKAQPKQQQQPQQPPQSQYQSASASHTSSTNSLPYLSETQAPYVITYPTEDIHENSVYRKQHPTSLPLQRSRNVSENSSASSSISHNLPSPGTNWTSNPIHNVDEILPQKQTKQTSQATIDANSIANNAYQPHSFAPTQAQTTSYDGVRTAPQTKSNVTPKPAATNTQYTPLHQSQPTQPKQHVKPPNQKPNTQSQPSIQVKPQQPPLQPRIQPVLQTKVAAPKLKTRSQTLSSTSHQHQSFEQDHQSPVLPRQRTFDSPTIPLQTQNRVLSQQSLVSSKQRQFEQHQQSDPQLLSESRRKSLGNVYDVQQQQRKSAYMSETKTVVKQEYKSSAPLDTPDIVKSSLPKEDIPILKKFGPPQRHHYMPNSYQSPTTNTKAQKFESSSNSTTKVIKNTQQQIVQHSTLTKKPSIVEIPATPQPDEDLIPRNIVFNNISAFTSMSRRHEESDRTRAEPQSRPNRLSKSDSWNQIVQLQNQANAQLPPTSPKFGISSGGSGSELRRTKSGHTLNVRMYEAGIDKAQVGEKKRTVEAYFTGKKSPNQIGGEETVEMRSAVATATTTTTAGAKKSTINRHKTSEKISASRKSLTTMTSNGVPIATATVLGGGLTRSATMPHIANLNLLDESNVEDAFEQLMMGS